jgi:hypothetical protein
MLSKFGRFLRQNTVAMLALFIALSGTTFAASLALPRNSVGTKQLKRNAVTSVKIKNNQVTGADVKESSLAKVPKATNADKLGGQAAAAYALVAQEPVHLIGATGEPPFENGWTNFGTTFSSAGFWKDSFGVVHLQGTIKNGAGATTAFTLPVGYRPAQDLFMPVATGATTAPYVYLRTTGAVQPQNNGGDDGFDGLSFRAAPATSAPAPARPSAPTPGR